MKRILEDYQLPQQQQQQWINKYHPLTIHQVLGNIKAIVQVKQWLQPNSPRHKKYAFMLLNGPPGVGKTLVAALAAESLHYRISAAV